MLQIAALLNAQVPDFIGQIKQIASWEQRENNWKIKPHVEEPLASTGNYNITYHRCEWYIDPAVYAISGKVTTYFIPLSPDFASINFDFANTMSVDSVSYHGINLSYSQDADNLLSISLPEAVPQNVLDSLSVTYHGVPIGTGFGSFIQSTHDGTPIIWSLSEPYGARDWWPCKQSLNDKIDSIDILVTCPEQYRDGSNGVLVSETQNGTNKTYHWKSHYPIAAYLVAIGVTNYSQYSDYAIMSNGDSLQILNYVYPENLSYSESMTPAIVPVIQLYDSLLKVDYPFAKEKYGFCQFGWGGGMEHQTMTYCSLFDEWILAHECAHQWFGDRITLGSWQDIWLNEGFAVYFEGLTHEYLPPVYWNDWKQGHIDYITSDPGGSVFVDDTTSVWRIFDSRLTYSKGAYLLNMLRWKLGDSLFFAGLHAYLTDPALAYGYARTADLQRNLQNVSGQDLTNFFNEWFYGQGYPSYHLRWYNVGNNWNVILSQTQSHPSVSFFDMPVPVELKDDTHDTTVVLNNTFSGQSFNVNLSFAPTQVILDPDLWIIHANDAITQIDTAVIRTDVIASTSLCPATSLNVSFDASGNYNSGNIFSAQLSSSTGSFADPAVIGSLASIANSGTIAATIPANASGTGYRIRVVSSNPAINGDDNGANISVKLCKVPTGISASSITKKTATISWNNMDCSSSYKIQYRPSGTTAWMTKNASTNSIVLKQLSANTTYQYHVMNMCSANGSSKSKYSAIYTFSTPLHRDEPDGDNADAVNDVNIYPNPAASNFTVEVNSNQQTQSTISVYTMVGELITQQKVDLIDGINTIPFQSDSFTPGLYLICIQTGQGRVVRKLTISK